MNIPLYIIKILRKTGLIKYANLFPAVTINNVTITIPVLKGIGEQNLSVSEPWMLDLFLSFKDQFGKGMLLDVGFNTGQTLMKYRAVFSDNGYVGFDPNPVCSYYVNELVQANHWKNITLVPTGVSTSTDLTELFLFGNEDEDSTASIVRDFRNNARKTLCIPVFDVRNTPFIKKLKDPFACIKIDVEGSELEVLQSCTDLMREQRPLVMIEILPAYSESNTMRLKRQLEVENIFRELNYDCRLIIKDSQNKLKELKELDSIGINTDINHCDYIYFPAELSM